MSKLKIIFSTSALLLLLLASCSKEKLEPLLYEGVIKDNYEPIWIMPKDPTGPKLCTNLCPMPVIGDEVIASTHKDGKAGFRRMKIETGKIVWECYLDEELLSNIGLGTGLFSLVNRQSYFVTSDEKCMVFCSKVWQNAGIHVAIDIEHGKLLWAKNIPSSGALHYDGKDHYYCNVENIYTPESSKYTNFYAYKISIADGSMEEVFRCRQTPEYYGSCEAIPFSYHDKDYLFLTEYINKDSSLIGYGNTSNHYGLVHLESGDTLLWADFGTNISFADYIADVHVHNGIVYVFKRLDYVTFDMNKLQFTDTVGLSLYPDLYTCHYFYNDKLLVGIAPPKGLNMVGWSSPIGHIIDVATNAIQRSNIRLDAHASILDDILYYTIDRKLQAVDINTGKTLMDIVVPKCYEAEATSSVYKNARGEKFVIVSSDHCTYCYPGL